MPPRTGRIRPGTSRPFIIIVFFVWVARRAPGPAPRPFRTPPLPWELPRAPWGPVAPARVPGGLAALASELLLSGGRGFTQGWGAPEVGSTWPGACSLERVHRVSEGSVTPPPPKTQRRASGGAPSHLSPLSKAPTLVLGLLLKFVSLLLRLPVPSQSLQVTATRFSFFGLTCRCCGGRVGPWFRGHDRALRPPWRSALPAAPVLGSEMGVPRALGKGVIHLQNLERILLIFFLPSPVFCY